MNFMMGMVGKDISVDHFGSTQSRGTHREAQPKKHVNQKSDVNGWKRRRILLIILKHPRFASVTTKII